MDVKPHSLAVQHWLLSLLTLELLCVIIYLDKEGGKVMVSKLEKNREGGWQVTVDLPEGKFCRIFHYKVDEERLIQDIDNIVERVRNYGLNGYFKRQN
mgnify:CR=1 FL=1